MHRLATIALAMGCAASAGAVDSRNCRLLDSEPGACQAVVSEWISVFGQNHFTTYLGAGSHVLTLSGTQAGQFQLSDDVRLDGLVKDLAVDGDHIYVAADQAGLQIIDNGGDNQTVVASMDFGSAANGLALAGHHLYVACGTSGLMVVDVSDPAAPQLVATLDTFDAMSVVVEGDIAYLADGENGLSALDVSDPLDPRQLGNFNNGIPVRDLSLIPDQQMALLPQGGAGLQFVDIADPRTMEPELSYMGDAPVGHAVAGWPFVYVAEGNGVRVLDLEALEVLDWFELPGMPQDLSLQVVEDPFASALLVYAADDAAGLRVLDLTNLAFGGEIASYEDMGYTHHVKLANNKVFTTEAGWGRLRIINNDDPADLHTIGSVNTPDKAANFDVSGNEVLLAASAAGLLRVDVADPAAPAITQQYLGPDDAPFINLLDVEWDVIARKVAVVDQWMGFYNLGVTNPANPTLRHWFDTPGQAYGLTVRDDLAYVADGASGIRVIDFSTNEPFEAGGVNTVGLAHQILFEDGYAYVADGLTGGLSIYDNSDPTRLVWLGELMSPSSWTVGLAKRGDLLYLADFSNGLRIVDVSDPAVPVEMGHYITPGRAFAVDVDDDGTIYLADGLNGLVTLEYDPTLAVEPVAPRGPRSFTLLPAVPNPFNPNTELRFELARAQHATLSVFDLMGRLVAQPANGEFAAGAHSVPFDGGALASGTYVCELETAEGRSSIKLTLLK